MVSQYWRRRKERKSLREAGGFKYVSNERSQENCITPQCHNIELVSNKILHSKEEPSRLCVTFEFTAETS